jgi:hypothetical protein
MSEGRPLLGSINNAAPAVAIGQGAGGSAGVLGSIFNLTNTILGAGLLAIPFAFRLSGVVMGIMFLVVRELGVRGCVFSGFSL